MPLFCECDYFANTSVSSLLMPAVHSFAVYGYHRGTILIGCDSSATPPTTKQYYPTHSY